MAKRKDPGRRRVLCTSCDMPLEVAEEARSVNCLHCNTRVITEEMTVDNYVAVRRFATANRVHITKKGRVYASVRAESLEIDGFLQGEAVSLGTIRIGKNARVTANLRAPFIVLDPSAVIVGEMRIGPNEVPELKNLEKAPAETEAKAKAKSA
jgi:LSD1 subclass zinc finger protein